VPDHEVDQQTAEAPVTRKDLEQYMNQLGGAFSQVLTQQQALAQRLEQQQQRGGAAPAAPTPPISQEDARERLRAALFNEPERVIGNAMAEARLQARQEFEQRLEHEREQAMRQQYAQALWAQFFQANQDLAPVQNEVFAIFNQTSPQYDFSDRANYARDQVRARLQQIITQANEAEKRQRQGNLLAAGAPGASGAPAGAAPARGADYEKTSGELTRDYLQERLKRKAMQTADQLRNDNEYWDEHKRMKLRRQNEAKARRVA